MPIACDKCRENLALLIEPKTSNANAEAFARAASMADSESARAVAPALSAAERAELEAHVASCPECARELALLRSMIGELQTLPIAAAPASLRASIRTEIAGEIKNAVQNKKPASQPAWLQTWRNFLRSPSRVTWATGLAMAAFAMIMLRDQPISTLPPESHPDYSTGAPSTKVAPQGKTPKTDKSAAKGNANSVERPTVAGGGTKASPSPSFGPLTGKPAAQPAPSSTASERASSDMRDETSTGRRHGLAKPAPNTATAKPSVSPLSGQTSVATAPHAATGLAATGPATKTSPAMTAPAATAPHTEERFATITVLPPEPEAAAGAGISGFGGPVSPATADAIPGAANTAPVDGDQRRAFKMRGGGGGAGEIDDATTQMGPSPASPPAALTPPAPGHERIAPRGLGRMAEIENGGQNSAKSTLPSSPPHGFMPAPAPGNQEMVSSAQNYAAQDPEGRTDQHSQATGAASSDSTPALMAAPAPKATNPAPTSASDSAAHSSLASPKSKGQAKAIARRHGSSLPVGRTAEIEVVLAPSQSAAKAEARVMLPLGLRFTTRSFEKSQKVWSGPVSQKKALNVRFKVTGAQSGLWPVDITLQKPDGTKLDSMTVQVIVVP